MYDFKFTKVLNTSEFYQVFYITPGQVAPPVESQARFQTVEEIHNYITENNIYIKDIVQIVKISNQTETIKGILEKPIAITR